MKVNHVVAVAVLSLLLSAGSSAAKVRIVASTTDLASIAEMIGGDDVKVESICRGAADPHFVQLLPSYMVKVGRADIYLKVGMDLDYWANQIIDGSQNADLVIVDCSSDIDPMEVPNTRVDASMGDVHIKGNPHYWLAPNNGIRIAEVVRAALKRVDPDRAAEYDARFTSFQSTLEAKMRDWEVASEPMRGTEMVTYHNSWPYFARYFGIKVVGFVEPKPGIEPTASHTAQLIALMNSSNVRIIGKEPYFSDRAPKSIARQTGAVVVDLPTSVGGVKAAKDYFALFDTLIAALTKALEE
jgi:zinc/manganese transport system substrate-binding protein